MVLKKKKKTLQFFLRASYLVYSVLSTGNFIFSYMTAICGAPSFVLILIFLLVRFLYSTYIGIYSAMLGNLIIYTSADDGRLYKPFGEKWKCVQHSRVVRYNNITYYYIIIMLYTDPVGWCVRAAHDDGDDGTYNRLRVHNVKSERSIKE